MLKVNPLQKISLLNMQQKTKTDFLKMNYQERLKFIGHPEAEQTESTQKQPIEKPKDWDKEIAQLEKYFLGIELPKDPVRLNACSTITNISLFIKSHLAAIKANNGKRTALPHLERLQSLKEILKQNNLLTTC